MYRYLSTICLISFGCRSAEKLVGDSDRPNSPDYPPEPTEEWSPWGDNDTQEDGNGGTNGTSGAAIPASIDEADTSSSSQQTVSWDPPTSGDIQGLPCLIFEQHPSNEQIPATAAALF